MDDYSSDFESTTKRKAEVRRKDDLVSKVVTQGRTTGMPDRLAVRQEYDRQRWLEEKQHLIGMNAVERHQEMVKNYLRYYGGKMEDFRRNTSKDRDDVDVLKANHRFLWNGDEQEEAECAKNWERRLAKKYYDKLFREFAIADLSFYQQGKLALRWRTEKEVLSGKGQFECAAKRCEVQRDLATWEVNFAYLEDNVKKNALVKLRLCPTCSDKLNFKHQAKRVTTCVAEAVAQSDADVNATSTSKSSVKRKNETDNEATSSKKTKTDSEQSNVTELEKRIWSASAETDKDDDADAQHNLDAEIDAFLKSMLF